jgi:hypothetical protein
MKPRRLATIGLLLGAALLLGWITLQAIVQALATRDALRFHP